MKQSKGFTLIELVMVIVILGILAVTAAPKFLNLQTDARVATLHGLAGAIKSAAAIAHTKALLAGVEGLQRGEVKNAIGNYTLITKYGYPVGVASTGEIGITSLSGVSVVSGLDDLNYATDKNSDWVVLYGDNESVTLGPYSKYGNLGVADVFQKTDCSVYYEAPTEKGGEPTVTVDENNC